MTNRIHPTAIIGDGVELGDDNVIGPYSVIVGPCRIGNGNWIGPYVSIGTPAEDRNGPHPAAWEGELAGHGVRIGDNNRFREFTSVHQGTHRETTIGDGNYMLVRSHVGHDGVLHDAVTLASAVQLGGHVVIWSHANIGMGTVIHQTCEIGPGAMVGMGSAVRKTTDPFTISVGNPARVSGINVVGLSRRGCDEETIAALEPFLKGKGELPASGLPEEVASLLKAWTERTPQH